MFGFPPKESLVGLIGLRIEQVCIGANEVIIRIEGNATIAIESLESFWRENPLLASSSEGAYPFHLVLSQRIADVTVPSRDILVLHFSGGASVRLRDDSSSAESVILNVPGGNFIV
jgi:hypothetical protein